ncbi:DUF7344 domain-containing protein [Haladaptatus sp. NG-WS-4]
MHPGRVSYNLPFALRVQVAVGLRFSLLTEYEWADDELRRLETQLRHVHLPKLADDGYIEWNPGTETIRRGPNFDDIAPLLTLMDDHEDELPDDWP